MPTSARAPSRTATGKKRVTPQTTGTGDPRPLTDYSCVHTVVAGHSRLTITLEQPCIIRSPRWAVIDCVAGARSYPSTSTRISNTEFRMDFGGLLENSTAFVEPPYQDMEVQNFQGGFVKPGGQWFREPVIPV